MSENEGKAPQASATAAPAEKPAGAKPASPKPAKTPKDVEGSSKSLVVKNAVGEYIRAKSLKVSSDLFEEEGLNGILKDLLGKACKRCEANGRKTVMTQDL